jgi:MFS family permease
MVDAALPARPGSALRRAIPALGVTQIIAWGTVYYPPAVLKQQLAADLGIGDTAIFAGVAVTLIVAALIAWPVGRLMDRNGAGRLMPAGSLVLALGLIVLGSSTGWKMYFLAWVIFGFGMALAMSNATFSALTQMAGQGARRAIIVIMLFGGMASTIFWPLTQWLEPQLGWRNTCFVFAAIHVLICAPLHAVFVAGGTAAGMRQDLRQDETPGAVAPEKRRTTAALIALAVSGNGFVSWGLDLHLITVFTEFGLTAALAVWIAALKGPATLMARGTDFLLAGRITPMGSALAGGVLIPAGLACALVFGQGLAAAVVFIMVYSFGAGLMTVARATLPLALLGSQGYAVTIGRLTLPTQIVYAVSPMTFSLLIERLGTSGALSLAFGASLCSLGALMVLARLVRTAPG